MTTDNNNRTEDRLDQLTARIIKIEIEKPILERLAVVEHQNNRILSDVVNEKETKIRNDIEIATRFSELEKRQTKTEHVMILCTGVVVTLQVIIGLWPSLHAFVGK